MGLYYYRFRYYRPEIGRFLQTDPLGYFAGLNLYTYVGNNPLNWLDPWGLCEFERDTSHRHNLKELEALLGKRLTNDEFYNIKDGIRMRLEDVPSHRLLGPLEIVKHYGSWDSPFFKDPIMRDTLYIFQGRSATGGDLNYYALGLLMGWRGVSKPRAVLTVVGWKLGRYGKLPSSNTLHYLGQGMMEGKALRPSIPHNPTAYNPPFHFDTSYFYYVGP